MEQIGLIVGMLIAVGIAIWVWMQKQTLAGSVDKLKKGLADAEEQAEKNASRVQELEKKLSKSKNALDSHTSSTTDLGQLVDKLQQENRQLRNTVQLTSTKDNEAASELAFLRTEVTRLKDALAESEASIEEVDRKAETRAREIAAAEKSRRQKVIEELRNSAELSMNKISEEYQSKVEAIVHRYNEMKQRLLESEKELRVAKRMRDNSDRAYNITLAQLDLAQDKLYTLESGQEPDARKQRLEKALGLAAKDVVEEPEDTTPPVVIDVTANFDRKPEPEVEETTDEPVAVEPEVADEAPDATESEAAADDVDADAEDPTEDSDAVAEAEESEQESEATAEAEAEAKPEKRSAVRRRRKAKAS